MTVVLALSALTTGRRGFKLPDSVNPWLIAALAAFVVAAALAIGANAPQLYRAVDTGALGKLVRERWSLPADDALKTLTATRLADLQRAQRANDTKGWLLLGAVVAQGVAICCLTVIAVGTVLGW